MVLNLKKRYSKREVEDIASKVVTIPLHWLDAPVTVVDWSAAYNFTHVDVSELVPLDSISSVYLNVDMSFNDSGESKSKLEARFRPNGSTETEKIPKVRGSSATFVIDEVAYTVPFFISELLFAPCAGNVFEVGLFVIDADPTDIVFKAHLLGYLP